MKSYKLMVSDEKAGFVMELLDNLGISFSEIEPVAEPRIYPGANFEIRSRKSGGTVAKNLHKPTQSSVEERQESLLDVMKKIEAMRKK